MDAVNTVMSDANGESSPAESGLPSQPEAQAAAQDTLLNLCSVCNDYDEIDAFTAVSLLYPDSIQKNQQYRRSAYFQFIRDRRVNPLIFRKCKCVTTLWQMDPGTLFKRPFRVRNDFQAKFGRRAIIVDEHTPKQTPSSPETAGPPENCTALAQQMQQQPLLLDWQQTEAQDMQPNAMQYAQQMNQQQAASSAPASSVTVCNATSGVMTCIKDYIRPLQDMLVEWCWTSGLLHLFLKTQSEWRPGLKSCLEILHDARPEGLVLRDCLIKIVKEECKHDLFQRFSGVRDVLNYELKKLLSDEEYMWTSISDIAADDEGFMNNLEKFCNDKFKQFFHPKDILPGSSFAISFLLPSWLAQLFLFNIQHLFDIQDKLVGLGYRSFSSSPHPLPNTGLTASHAGATDVREGEGGGSHKFTFICGYNIGVCPPDVGTGISFEGLIISQEQHDLVKKVCVCVCVHVRVFCLCLVCVCFCVILCLSTYINVHKCTCIHKYVHKCTGVYVYTCINVY